MFIRFRIVVSDNFLSVSVDYKVLIPKIGLIMWVGEQLLLLDNLLTYLGVILLFLHIIKLCYVNVYAYEY